MSSGVEHYRQADRLIEQSKHYTHGDGSGSDWGRQYGANLLAEAQAHATLADAAAVMELARTIAVSNGAGEEPGWNEALTAREHEDPAEVADVIAMRAEMAQTAGDDGPDVTP